MPTLELSLNSSLYSALEQEAQQRNQSVEEIVEAAVTNFLAASTSPELAKQPTHTTTGSIRRAKIHVEAEAWQKIPAAERSRYQGQFVAVHQGLVIDHDSDRLQLYRRVHRQLGDTPVLITPADAPHPREFRILSPRLDRRL
jgi:hypothetical protein